MTEVISVKFKDGGKAYYFDPAGHTAKSGDTVIVEMQNGREMGFVSEGNHPVPDEDIVPPLCKMLRFATEKDYKKVYDDLKDSFDGLDTYASEDKIEETPVIGIVLIVIVFILLIATFVSAMYARKKMNEK